MQIVQKMKEVIKVRWIQLVIRIISFSIIILILLLALLWLIPISALSVSYQNTVNGSYNQATSRINQVQSRDGSNINDLCRTKSLLHKEKVEHSLVIFHGFTNCPEQFGQLAKTIFESGWNVYIPRIPHHGNSDVLTEDLDNLTSLELINTIAESVDIASGLGENVHLMGISGGSVMAAWGGYYYENVDSVFLNAPLFTPVGVSSWQLAPVRNLLTHAPLGFRWWDTEAKQDVVGPSYAYPRFSYKAVSAFLDLSIDLKRSLNKSSVNQSGKKLIIVTTEDDPGINNSVVKEYTNLWIQNAGVELTYYQFPLSDNLVHDFIDPNQQQANTELVYPKIVGLLMRQYPSN